MTHNAFNDVKVLQKLAELLKSKFPENTLVQVSYWNQ